MKQKYISLIIFCHHPFVCTEPKGDFSEEEHDFFEALSETWLPILDLFELLEEENLPFRLGMVLSPSLCGLLQDNRLLERFLEWMEKRIDFGKKELKRCAANEEMKILAEQYYNRDCRIKTAMTEKYNMDILGAFADYHEKGKVEFLLTTATNSYLPFYASMGEAIRAQIETALIHHRKYLGKNPTGFWLPEMGWTAELGNYLSEYGLTYTIADTHALVMGNPPAETGFFYPVKTSSGFLVFGRDSTAQQDLENHITAESGIYRSCHDAGFELSPRTLKQFLGGGKTRYSTGYRYWTCGVEKKHQPYNREAAKTCAAAAAKKYLDLRLSRLEAASEYMDNPVCICTLNADELLRTWHEGIFFLKTLISEIDQRKTPCLCTPSDYLAQITSSSIQTVEPGYSSNLLNGYAELLLDASNDWIYRHIFRSIQRMTELTERFTGDTGLKERTLNQAARELLFAQSTDWSKALNPQYQSRVNRDHAKQELEGALRNFTTIYEALGSSHISTEWLTALERKHYFLPFINHRVFARKK
ncbi:MAG: DUF1957 domain-containing protein [Treponema sp.]|nr:DUF1957 domain-containing protein [Treponema sp.]